MSDSTTAAPVLPASRLMQRAFDRADEAGLGRQLATARAALAAFVAVTTRQGSLIRAWTDDAPLLTLEHYPPDDVVDHGTGLQYYYHAHRDGADEHGHVHVFWQATAGGQRRRLRGGGPHWVRTAPSHLLAIGLDARGLPVSLFTVNRWVTDGHWFDAARTLAMVDRVCRARPGQDPHADSTRWLVAFLRFYRPVIERLLAQRDQRLSRCVAHGLSLPEVHADEGLELLSLLPIDWAGDLAALEHVAAVRGLVSDDEPEVAARAQSA